MNISSFTERFLFQHASQCQGWFGPEERVGRQRFWWQRLDSCSNKPLTSPNNIFTRRKFAPLISFKTFWKNRIADHCLFIYFCLNAIAFSHLFQMLSISITDLLTHYPPNQVVRHTCSLGRIGRFIWPYPGSSSPASNGCQEVQPSRRTKRASGNKFTKGRCRVSHKRFLKYWRSIFWLFYLQYLRWVYQENLLFHFQQN